MKGFSDTDSGSVEDLLVRRGRVGLAICLVSIAIFAVADLLLRSSMLAPLYFVKVVQAAVIGGVLFALGRQGARERPIPTLVVGAALVCVTTALSGVVSGDFATTRMLFIVLTLVTASLFPWGLWPQAIVASIAALSLAWNTGAVGGIGALFDYPTIGAGMGFAVSAYLAHAFESTRSLAEVRERDRKAIARMRSDLIRMLSHDIKNPIGAVMGYAELLRTQLKDGGDLAECLDGIESAAEQAMSLALNFLDADRIETGALELHRTPVSLNDVVEHVVRHQTPRARLRALVLRRRLAGDVPVLDLDQPLVERAIANVLSNAIKFSPAGAEVIVETKVGGTSATIEISDRGPGIAPEELPNLFRRYGRGAGSRTDSTGLGLFVVKTIVEAHGGRVDVRRRGDDGSSFEVSFPIERVAVAVGQ